MIIAFATEEHGIEAELSNRFGRAKEFSIFNTETEKWSVLSNKQNLQSAQGAGIQSAQTLIKEEAQMVVAAHMGPKAFQVLQAAGIEIYLTPSAPIAKLLLDLLKGRILQQMEPDVEGHW